ncbi:MAG: hypothetical protein NVV74_03510 [Magnetospirillum sp.]|nr:hypothetical protein [Magnetospirillum sp.]
MEIVTDNQRFHLILADVAMAMAISTLDGGKPVCEGDYQPGAVRDGWLARVTDPALRQRVTALANAGLGALQAVAGEDLVEKARRFGVPLSAELAREICEHFAVRRERVLTYRR